MSTTGGGSKPGDKVLAFRNALSRSLDGLVRELAWNVAEHGRRVVVDSYVSKGTLLSSWNINVGAVDPSFASTAYEPNSWLESNELRQNYDAQRRESLARATLAKFSMHVYVSNSTPYLSQAVNLNEEYGGRSNEPLDKNMIATEVFTFAAAETKRMVRALRVGQPNPWGGAE